MKFLKYIFVIASMIAVILAQAQNIPERPDPPRLVNDFTQTLNKSQVDALEKKLRDYNDTTSTQIVVVLVPDLQDYEPQTYAYKIGETWGVGRAGKNNGAVILIKPKTKNSRGQAFIATGYGLEGPIPDALAKRIVENEMIPSFSQNDYYHGIDAAINTMMSLASGEFTGEEYLDKQSQAPGGVWLVPIIIIIIILVLMRNGQNNNHFGSRGNLPFWTALWLASQASRSHSGSWGGFSGGSGGFGGGGGGGFGGFGGGSFGGGGAGGSW